jgi:hypothetical protein
MIAPKMGVRMVAITRPIDVTEVVSEVPTEMGVLETSSRFKEQS